MKNSYVFKTSLSLIMMAVLSQGAALGSSLSVLVPAPDNSFPASYSELSGAGLYNQGIEKPLISKAEFPDLNMDVAGMIEKEKAHPYTIGLI